MLLKIPVYPYTPGGFKRLADIKKSSSRILGVDDGVAR